MTFKILLILFLTAVSVRNVFCLQFTSDSFFLDLPFLIVVFLRCDYVTDVRTSDWSACYRDRFFWCL
jgi:hypothetical protein